MFGLSHALSSFNSNARNAWPLLPMRKDGNRVLGCTLDSLPDSLANTADQAAARGCLHTTGIGRLFVVYHGQAGGNDRSVVDWLEHHHGCVSASSESNLPAPSIFRGFVCGGILRLSLLGLPVVSLHHQSC